MKNAAVYVQSAESYGGVADFNAAQHGLRVGNGIGYGVDGLRKVHDHSLAQPPRRRLSHGNNMGRLPLIGGFFGNNHRYFAGAQIQAGEDVGISSHSCSLSLLIQ